VGAYVPASNNPAGETIMTDSDAPSAWPQIAALIDAAPFPVEIAPPSDDHAADMEALHAHEGTTLGAMISHTGGLLIDHGWVRLLGSHSERLGRSLVGWNAAQGLGGDGRAPGLLIVGDDVLGGIFAIDGGAFGGEPGLVWYFGPDSLSWEPLNCGFTALLHFLIGPGLDTFYADHRWPGWAAEVDAISGDGAIFLHPPLWAVGPNIPERHRGAVPMTEMLAAHAKVLPELKKHAPALFPGASRAQ
jgi:hypothetical protein